MIHLIESTSSRHYINPDITHMTKFETEGEDTRTFAWVSVCPYTGKQTDYIETYKFDGVSQWNLVN